MGLFSNKDKACPICGGATPRILAKKFDGQPICGKCADQIMADSGLAKSWTLADLQEHLNARAENLRMIENFIPTHTVEYEHEAVIDDRNQLFYIKRWTVDNPPVFRFSEITGFTIEFGYQVVESWSRGMVREPFQPIQTGLLGGIAVLAEAFSDKEKENEYETLKVILKVNTPYLSEYELCDLSVSGKGQAEFASDLSREMGKVNTICNLIISLTEGVSTMTSSTASGTGHTADDILKFKELLDAGAITQEEFNQKKKQLLGI